MHLTPLRVTKCGALEQDAPLFHPLLSIKTALLSVLLMAICTLLIWNQVDNNGSLKLKAKLIPRLQFGKMPSTFGSTDGYVYSLRYQTWPIEMEV